MSTDKPLAGRVALVAGATRGAGRGIACMLGEAGATVYCSGRSTREHPPSTGDFAGRRETIDETSAMVTERGGIGIAVRTDHPDEAQVAALGARIEREQRRLDVLVNDISEGENARLDAALEGGSRQGIPRTVAECAEPALHSSAGPTRTSSPRATPLFVGVLDKSGGLYTSVALVRGYGFTDVDGARPDISPHVKAVLGPAKTGIEWHYNLRERSSDDHG
jgi:NAD(P)-dependent dehydrogenase (short-subunit alcohol dehydrogenase family)